MTSNRTPRGTRHVLLTALGALLLAAAPQAHAIFSFQVDSVADTPDARPGDGRCADALFRCTLRAAVDEANDQALSGADSIVGLPAGRYVVGAPLGVVGHLQVAGSDRIRTEIVGPAAGPLFAIDEGGQLWLRDLTLEEARIDNEGGLLAVRVTSTRGRGIFNDGGFDAADCRFERGTGSALVNRGRANLMDVEFVENGGPGTLGGAIVNSADATLFVSFGLFVANHADTGGAVYNVGTIEIYEGVFLSNQATGNGGAIYSRGAFPALVRKSSVSWSFAGGDGGGLDVGGHFEIRNSTLLANGARGDGGGARIEGDDVRMENVTVVDNLAGYGGEGFAFGGGLLVESAEQGPRLANSIVALNRIADRGLAPDCLGPVRSAGHNLLGIDEGCDWLAEAGDDLGSIASPLDPELEPLAVAGNQTHVRMPRPGGPAHDRGNPQGCTDAQGNLLLDDQIGQKRHMGEACDRGAVEARE